MFNICKQMLVSPNQPKFKSYSEYYMSWMIVEVLKRTNNSTNSNELD